MTNTLINGMKNAKLEKLVNIMALSAFLLIMGMGRQATAIRRERMSRRSVKPGLRAFSPDCFRLRPRKDGNKHQTIIN